MNIKNTRFLFASLLLALGFSARAENLWSNPPDAPTGSSSGATQPALPHATGAIAAPVPEPVVEPAPAAAQPFIPAAPLQHEAMPGQAEPVPATAHAEAEPAGDLWQRIRDGFGLSNVDTPLVARHRAAFAAEPAYVDRIVERSRRYLFHIVEAVEARGMPTEIALLPIVESAFNPKAYSRAHASGIWQFIPATGKRYGLAQNWWYDGRRDVIAATDAALDYLQALHNMFGDWHLALAAYNCGEGCVQRAVARNRSQGLPVDFDSLSLPRETRNYVPKLLAVRDIVKSPEIFGMSLAPIPNERYFSAVSTTRHIDVKRAAQFAEITMDEFLDLNPAYDRPVITAHTEQVILVPAEKADFFRANLENPDRPLLSWKAYKMQRGASFDKVARDFGLTSAELKRVNGISQTKRVAGGGTILVPTNDNVAQELPTQIQPESLVAAPPPPVSIVKHRVRRGETLASVARRYRVSMAQLKSWNGLRSGKVIAGQHLSIHKTSGHLMMVAAPASASHYVVRRGDSWYSIARRFNVSVATLQSWNKRRPLLAGSRVFVSAPRGA